MALTADDVRSKQFRTVRMKEGYDETEVDEFLDDVVAPELERLLDELASVRAQLQSAGRPAATAPATAAAAEPVASATEAAAGPMVPAAPEDDAQTATGILLLAQRTAAEHTANAQAEAARVIEAARAQADALTREAEENRTRQLGELKAEASTLQRSVEALRAFEREYRSQLSGWLQRQLAELEANGIPDLGPLPELPGRTQDADGDRHLVGATALDPSRASTPGAPTPVTGDVPLPGSPAVPATGAFPQPPVDVPGGSEPISPPREA